MVVFLSVSLSLPPVVWPKPNRRLAYGQHGGSRAGEEDRAQVLSDEAPVLEEEHPQRSRRPKRRLSRGDLTKDHRHRRPRGQDRPETDMAGFRPRTHLRSSGLRPKK